MVRIKSWCKVEVSAVPFWHTFETSRYHFVFTEEVQDQILLNKSWPVLQPQKNSYIVGSPESPRGRSIYISEPLLVEGFINASCRSPSYFPHTSGGLADACWCSASAVKNNVVILLAELALDWKISWTRISLVSDSAVALEQCLVLREGWKRPWAAWRHWAPAFKAPTQLLSCAWGPWGGDPKQHVAAKLPECMYELSPSLRDTKKEKQFQPRYWDSPSSSSNSKKGGVKRADQSVVSWELSFVQTRWEMEGEKLHGDKELIQSWKVVVCLQRIYMWGEPGERKMRCLEGCSCHGTNSSRRLRADIRDVHRKKSVWRPAQLTQARSLPPPIICD